MHISFRVNEGNSPLVDLSLSLAILAAAILQCILSARWIFIRIRRITGKTGGDTGNTSNTGDTWEISDNPWLFSIYSVFLLLSIGLVVYSGLVFTLPGRSSRPPFQLCSLVLLILIPRV
jgi:ABC-type branched-subunit amino acid transport system permease subunit